MCAPIFEIIVVIIVLNVNNIYCQPPEWRIPTDLSEHSINIDDDNACSPQVNVLKEDLYAKSETGQTVFYRIVSQTPADETFYVSENIAAEVIVACHKDKVKSSAYNVTLGASYNQKTNLEEATITVKVLVQGLAGPKKPEFIEPNPDPLKDDHFIYIPESIQPGMDVIKLVATDGDDSSGSKFIFNMDESIEITRQLFEIKNGTDMLTIRSNVSKNHFDIERKNTKSVYPIVLQVGNGVSTSSLSTQIHVVDVNDNAPEFSGKFHASIPSNAGAGYVVSTITVRDNDKTSPNNHVTLSLTGADEFRINGTDIVVADGAKFTSDTSKYTLIITATDGAPNNSKSTKQRITVNIILEPIGSANRNTYMMGTTVPTLILCFLYNY